MIKTIEIAVKLKLYCWKNLAYIACIIAYRYGIAVTNILL